MHLILLLICFVSASNIAGNHVEATNWSLVTGRCENNIEQPDAGRNVSEVITSRGYGVEEHDVQTADGYILTVFRVVNPLIAPRYRRSLRVVLLQHGLFTSAMDWLINSSPDDKPASFPGKRRFIKRNKQQQHQSNSLAFYLSNLGFDVWLGNCRGNEYGRRHVRLSANSSRFWSFTFDEHSKYDLPDTISYILHVTKKAKLSYVGHSQGTAIMFGLLADRPSFERFIKPFVALAPVAYVDHIMTPIRHLDILTPIMEHLNASLDFTKAWKDFLIRFVCQSSTKGQTLCMNMLFVLSGFDREEFDESRLLSIFCHLYSGTSVKNIAHYGQEVLTGRFAHFDHGILGNQIHYGSTRAPDYNLSRIKSKYIALFSSDNDWLSSPIDVAHLRQSLSVKPMSSFNMTQTVAKWNHLDYIYAKTTSTSINPKILQVLNSSGNNDK